MSHIRQRAHLKYNNWLKMYVENNEGYITKQDGTHLTHEDYCRYFIRNILDIVTINGYYIEDKNLFKKKIAKFIYKLSDHSNE